MAAVLIIAAAAHQARAKSSHQPDAIRAMVVTEALDLGLPVALALAVAHAESNFDPRALSHKGARGVMQIMPATGKGVFGVDADELWKARLNVQLGIDLLGSPTLLLR